MLKWLCELDWNMSGVAALTLIVSISSLVISCVVSWQKRKESKNVALLSQRMNLREILHSLIVTLEHADQTYGERNKVEDVVDFARAWFLGIEETGIGPRLCGCGKQIFRVKHEFVTRVCSILRQVRCYGAVQDVWSRADLLAQLIEDLEYYATECACHPDSLTSGEVRQIDINLLNKRVAEAICDWEAIEHAWSSDISI